MDPDALADVSRGLGRGRVGRVGPARPCAFATSVHLPGAWGGRGAEAFSYSLSVLLSLLPWFLGCSSMFRVAEIASSWGMCGVQGPACVQAAFTGLRLRAPVSCTAGGTRLHLEGLTVHLSLNMVYFKVFFFPFSSFFPSSFASPFLFGIILKFSSLLLASVRPQDLFQQQGWDAAILDALLVSFPGSLFNGGKPGGLGGLQLPPCAGRPSGYYLSHLVLFYVFLYFDKVLSAGMRNSRVSTWAPPSEPGGGAGAAGAEEPRVRVRGPLLRGGWGDGVQISISEEGRERTKQTAEGWQRLVSKEGPLGETRLFPRAWVCRARGCAGAREGRPGGEGERRGWGGWERGGGRTVGEGRRAHPPLRSRETSANPTRLSGRRP